MKRGSTHEQLAQSLEDKVQFINLLPSFKERDHFIKKVNNQFENNSLSQPDVNYQK